MVTNINGEPSALLNKAALEWCVGGPFFPGIEMSYLAYDKKTFREEYNFRYGRLQTSCTYFSYR
jgi:hypothetical protein